MGYSPRDDMLLAEITCTDEGGSEPPSISEGPPSYEIATANNMGTMGDAGDPGFLAHLTDMR